MIEFSGQYFLEISLFLDQMLRLSEGFDHSPGEKERDALIGVLQGIDEQCEAADLRFSQKYVERIRESLAKEKAYTLAACARDVRTLQDRISDEFESVRLLRVPSGHSSFYDDSPQFGDIVAAKFSSAVTDIQEGAKCFATGRYTATVFHLMRVMEMAVQQLGKKLGINLVQEKNWHNILEEVDKAIKALPAKHSRQKALRNRYAQASSHLRMVKDAWRNDVMHPKQTYTEEEAERVFRNVKDFMVHLATKL